MDGESCSLNIPSRPPQGKFPKGDKAEDGFHGVSPVNAFPPQNDYGKTAQWVAVSAHRLAGGMILPGGRGRRSSGGKQSVPGQLVRAGVGGVPSQGLSHRCAAGLYDLMGNVWEWTASQYQAADQDMRVLRGASWIDTADGSANHRARVTTR